MRRLNWLFGSRRVEPAPMDGAIVLDRLEARLGSAVRGEARLILAGQLESAVTKIADQPSLSTAAMAAHREGARIASLLPRPLALAVGAILADELVRSRRILADSERSMRSIGP